MCTALRVPGETAFEEGDVGDSVFFVIKGCAIEGSKRDGVTWTGRTVRVGETFGQWHIIMGKTRPCTVTAQSACVLRELSRGALEGIIVGVGGGGVTGGADFRGVVETVGLKRAEKRLGAKTEAHLNPSAVRSIHFLKHPGYVAKVCGMPVTIYVV